MRQARGPPPARGAWPRGRRGRATAPDRVQVGGAAPLHALRGASRGAQRFVVEGLRREVEPGSPGSGNLRPPSPDPQPRSPAAPRGAGRAAQARACERINTRAHIHTPARARRASPPAGRRPPSLPARPPARRQPRLRRPACVYNFVRPPRPSCSCSGGEAEECGRLRHAGCEARRVRSAAPSLLGGWRRAPASPRLGSARDRAFFRRLVPEALEKRRDPR